MQGKGNNMKWIAVIAVTGSLILAGCGEEQEHGDHSHDNGDHSHDNGDSKAKAYPFKTCIVSGEELGSMGDPKVFVHEGQEVKLCCPACEKEFKEHTAKYMKMIADGTTPKKKGDGHDHDH